MSIKMKRTIKIIFTLSILLNIVLISFVGAHEYKKYKHQSFVDSFQERAAQMMAKNEKIPAENMKAQMQVVMQKKQELENILMADQFDLEAYTRLTQDLLDKKDEFARHKAQAIGQTLSELPKEERVEFARHAMKSIVHSDRGGRPRSMGDKRPH